MKKKFYFLLTIFLFTNIYADENYGVSINAGVSNDIDIYRLAVQKPFDNSVYNFDSFSILGFHEVGFNYWVGEKNNVHTLSYSPVFKLVLNDYQNSEFQPYFDFGIGVALASDTTIDNRNLSTAFLFEDRISLGISKDNWDLYFRYLHYSNAGLKSPNEGIDICVLGVNYAF